MNQQKKYDNLENLNRQAELGGGEEKIKKLHEY